MTTGPPRRDDPVAPARSGPIPDWVHAEADERRRLRAAQELSRHTLPKDAVPNSD